MIPNGNRYFRSIGLVRVLCKTVIGIPDHCLTAVIQFYNTLHLFCTRRGTSAAALESKLFHKLTAMREEVIYLILLDIHKSYDALYIGLCLDILAVYGVRTQVLHLLQRYWYRLSILTQAGS